MSNVRPHAGVGGIVKGFTDPQRPGFRTIAVRFDDDTFEAIARRAVKEGTSFAAQVRLLVEWGLEA